MCFTSLSHHMDMEWMREAYRRTRKDGAVGVDGQTAQEYEKDLEGNLKRLLAQAKSGSYRAPPVKRAYIPKDRPGEVRPLGIPTFEDKVLQRAVLMLLEPIYEQEFLNCSYGFRPRRSAHQATEALREILMNIRGGWVGEVDIRRFFDNLDHRPVQQILRQRVCDGVVLRLIGKWLNAGVLEGEDLFYSEVGTPQGGVISPLLANIYLHEVLDKWFLQQVQPRLRGRSGLVRFADDFVLVFADEVDARQVMDMLPKRFGRYGLELHPTKTRLLRFSRPPHGDPCAARRWRRSGQPRAFDFLGFTFFWGLSRRGYWVIKRNTASSRFSRAVRRLNQWLRRYRHEPIKWQHQQLTWKLRGHFNYYGVTCNSKALVRFLAIAERLWLKWLRRRDQRGKHRTWKWFKRVLARYPLPPPIAYHSVLRCTANP